MSRIHPQMRTPDFLTGDALVAISAAPGKTNVAPSTEWQCGGCGSLLIFDHPLPPPDEECPSCGTHSWKR